MRPAILVSAIAFSLISFSAIAADPAPISPPATPAPAASDDGNTDASRGTFTEGAAATDHTGHTMNYSTREPDLDRKPAKENQQVNITGVVEARAPDSQIICKFSPIIGSRLSTRLCLPLSRWKQMHQDAVQAIRDGEAASHYGGVHP